MRHEYVHEMFSRAAERFVNNTAIDCVDKRVIYAELEERSNNLANYLISSGASTGSIVGILTEDTVEIITAIIATLKANCVFVPLDPRIPEKGLETLVREVTPSWYVTESKFLPTIDRITRGAATKAIIICVDACPVNGEYHNLILAEDFEEYHNPQKPDVRSNPDDMCYIYFTSGSTGRPKGIAGRLKAIDHFIRWEIKTLGITEGIRVSQLSKPTFDAYLRDVFLPLCTGGAVCAPQGRETIINAGKLIEWIDRQQINIIHCVPSQFRSILNEELKPEYFSALRYVLMAGEPLFPSDVKKWMDVFEERIQLVNLYGQSETTMAKFFYFVKASDRERRSIPVGKPMENAKALVIDGMGRVCDVGGVGEIYIRTPFRTLGYFNQPELTKEVFIQNPFNKDSEDIVYKTGDQGRILEDGNFEFLGRKDQQVKIRGVRIELKEIEDLLLRYEGVKDVAVVDRDDSSGNKYLCAYVVTGRKVEPGALRRYLAEHIPDYIAPSDFIEIDSLPRTITGKVDRQSLPTPKQARAGGKGAAAFPRTPTEEILAGIWSRLLGIDIVDVNDSFFEVGGHSLLMTRLLSRVRAAFEVDLPLRVVFETPTVAGLAGWIEKTSMAGQGLSVAPIERVSREEELPLSFAQQRLWFLDRLDPGSAAYNIPETIRLTGQLNVAALEQSIGEIVRRHEVLRTTFPALEGRPVQIVATAAALSLPIVDLSGLPAAVREVQAKRLSREEAERAFDLSQGPLLRATVLRLSEEEQWVFFTMHHIISDAWSMAVLVREVTVLYKACAAGRRSPLAELPIQYVDFAVWQRRWLQAGTLETQLAYWKRQLSDLPAAPILPTDRPRPPARTLREARQRMTLSKSLTEGLRELSQKEESTLFMALVATFKALLYQYTEREDIVVGTDIANRIRVEAEELIGFFANQLVLRTDLSGNPTFRELLRRVRQVVINAYSNQDSPFDKLVEALNPDRGLSRSPLFQVKIVFQNIPQPALEIQGLTLGHIEVDNRTAKFDLMLTLWESQEGLHGDFEYDMDLFNATTIIGMVKQFESALCYIVAQPDIRLDDLAKTLDEADRHYRIMQEKELKEVSSRMFKTIKRNVISAIPLQGQEANDET